MFAVTESATFSLKGKTGNFISMFAMQKNACI